MEVQLVYIYRVLMIILEYVLFKLFSHNILLTDQLGIYYSYLLVSLSLNTCICVCVC